MSRKKINAVVEGTDLVIGIAANDINRGELVWMSGVFKKGTLVLPMIRSTFPSSGDILEAEADRISGRPITISVQHGGTKRRKKR